jgi:hypothetical protein
VILGVLTVACGGLGWFAYQRLGDRPGRIAKGPSQPNAFTGGADRQSWFEETATEKDWLDKNGPVVVVYLSDLAEIDVQMGPWQFGRGGLLGDPGNKRIQVQGRPSPKGLGTHPWDQSSTSVRYKLGPNALAFRAAVALNDTAENFPGNGVLFEVLGDGKSLAVSKQINRKDEFDVCHVDLRGVRVLELKTRTLNSHFGCHTVWLEPRILQRKQ